MIGRERPRNVPNEKRQSKYPEIKLESVLHRSEHKIEHLSSCAQVVHATTKQVISRHQRTRTAMKCTNMKNARAKRANYCFTLSNMQICRCCCRRPPGCLSSLFESSSSISVSSAVLRKLNAIVAYVKYSKQTLFLS